MEDKGKLYPEQCPICGVQTNYVYRINDGKNEALWYICNCGVAFQDKVPANDLYDDKYVAGYADFKDCDAVQTHAAKIYVPLIEELTYGRKMLDVGFNLPHNMNFFRDRGWICTGIDINKTFEGSKNVIIADFETIEFKRDDKGEIIDPFNFIWMSHSLEHFINPIHVLKKCYDIMPVDGVLFIATPEIGFISKTGVSNFPHWKTREHYVMWSERALTRELEKIGFEIIMKRRNFASRFVSWYDCHIIAQKRFF